MNVYEILSRDNYLTVNKLVMRAIGISESVLLSELCYRRQYLERAGQLTEDGFFYATIADVEEATTLSEYAQRKILDNMQQMGIVTVERRGLPAKRYICIHEEALQSLINCETSCDTPVPEDFSNKTLTTSGLNNNNINSNISHVSSKDDTLDRGCSTRSEKPHNVSGKLFSSEKPKTRKSLVQKTNNFISACQREAIKKKFPQEVLTVLDQYFRMLAELDCLLPAVSIAEQLEWLKKVSADRQVAVVKSTISRGWKSLQYEAEANIVGKVPAWDTADPDAFKAKTEEEKCYDWRQDVPDDQIF